MLKAITFDLWETLIHDSPEAEVRRREYRVREIGGVLRNAGLPLAEDALARAHDEVTARMDLFWKLNLDQSVLEQTKLFVEIAAGFAIDGRVPPAALLEASRHYAEAVLVHPPRPADGARMALAAARSTGLRLGLLCNSGRTPGRVLRELLARFELKAFFDAMCFSDEARIRKPAPEFFARALSRLGVRAEEAAHVGDKPDADMAGARAAGMRTVHIRPPGGAAAEAAAVDFTIGGVSELPTILDRLAETLEPA